MIRLFPKIVKMKRVTKSTTASISGEKHTNARRRKKSIAEPEQNDLEAIGGQNQTNTTENIKLEHEESATNEEQNRIETKIDLSKFKLASKQKVKSTNTTLKEPKKREHIPLEYDEDNQSSINKIKKESPSSDLDENNSDEELVEQTFSKKMPPNWEQVLENLREMRKERDAPVDSMGCSRCPDKNATPEDRRFQALLALMLSSQTKDQTVHATMLRLREHGCSLTNIINTPDSKLGKLIYPVSFWKTKVKNIKRAAEMIQKEFSGDIPQTVADLCKLPGVGPKMAYLCMEIAWGQVTGIGVDTHVHRITNRLGWVKTKTPENTRKALEGWLPRKHWSEVNLLLVGFGQQTCGSIKPQCLACLNNQLCPFGKKNLRTSKGKKN